MTELVIEMESATGAIRKPKGDPLPQGMALARWDDAFAEALLRLLQLGDSPEDMAVLGDSRLRQVYYAILKGDAGDSARHAIGENAMGKEAPVGAGVTEWQDLVGALLDRPRSSETIRHGQTLRWVRIFQSASRRDGFNSLVERGLHDIKPFGLH